MNATNSSTSIKTTQALTPVLSDRFVARWPHVVLTSCTALLFLLIAYRPISHTGSWEHVATGQWILANWTLPTVDPLFELAQGMPLASTEWLSQAAFASVQSMGGIEAVSGLLALIQFAAIMLFGFAAYRRSKSLAVAAAISLLTSIALWPSLGVVGSQALASLIFACLLVSIAGSSRETGPTAFQWIALPLLVAIWANVNATFVLGILTLLIITVGRFIQLAQAKQSLVEPWSDSVFQRWLWLTELCCLATLLQPSGWALWARMFDISSTSLWSELGGWQPIHGATWFGMLILLYWAALAVRVQAGKTPMSSYDWFGAIAVSILLVLNQSLAVYLVPLGAILLCRPSKTTRSEGRGSAARKDEAENAPGSFKFALSLICVLIVWVAFSLSPLSTPLLGGKGRRLDQTVDSNTPLKIGQFLADHPTQSLVWAPAYWGDWLAWTQQGNHRFFAGSNANRMPRQVVRDYGRVFGGDTGWEKTLDRYGIELMVVDKIAQPDLVNSALVGNSKWRMVYEDDMAMVFVRRDYELPVREVKS